MILVLLKSKLVQLALALTLGLLLGAYFGHRPPSVTGTQVNPINPQVTETTVSAPEITTKTVTKLIIDPSSAALAAKLLKENNAYKQQVQTLTSSQAEIKTGGGTADGGVVAEQVRPQPQSPAEPRIFQFSDYQLHAIYDNTGTHFDYTLDQKIRIVSTTSKDADGKTHVNLRAFREDPKGQIEIPTSTQAIIADPGQAHFFLSPRIQGGFALGLDKTRGGVVALQILKRGTSKAAEDTTYAILTPELILSSDKVTPGILPISFNLGRIKHNPLTNIWISPSVDLNRKVGIVFSATF